MIVSKGRPSGLKLEETIGVFTVAATAASAAAAGAYQAIKFPYLTTTRHARSSSQPASSSLINYIYLL